MMNYSQFKYPRHDTPLLQAYDGRFEAAFIALHPFFRMPVDVFWENSETEYPDDYLIRQHGQPIYWQSIMEAIECKDLKRFYIGMRTSIGALNYEYSDSAMAKQIYEYVDECNIFYPSEGWIVPLLVEPIGRYLYSEPTNLVLYLAEFAEEPEELSSNERFIQKFDEGLVRGSLFNTSVTRLATVDWDDFFTVIYGSVQELSSFLESNPLEGFFCTPTTLHTWCWQEPAIKPVVL